MQKITYLGIANSIGRSAEVLGEFPNGAEVGLLSAFAETGDSEVFGHALT